MYLGVFAYVGAYFGSKNAFWKSVLMVFSHIVLCVFGEIGERRWNRLWSEITFMCLRNKQVSSVLSV